MLWYVCADAKRLINQNPRTVYLCDWPCIANKYHLRPNHQTQRFVYMLPNQRAIVQKQRTMDIGRSVGIVADLQETSKVDHHVVCQVKDQ